MSRGHLVRPADAVELVAPTTGWAGGATGYRRCMAVGEDDHAVHTGFVISELDPGGSIPWHVHSFEESCFVVTGTAVIDTAEGSYRISEGGYGVVPIAMPHRWRNESQLPVRWVEMQAPGPRSAYQEDTFVVPGPTRNEVADIDVRDPRDRYFGKITPSQMDPAQQSQDLLEVTASMRTALLVYGGINVKMMVDSDLGAQLSTMFMVQYDPDGATGPHDHPFEETYFFLEGEAEATFDGKPVVLGAGDIAWAGVGCPHSFRNLGGGPLRWLETQAPQPPRRHSYRFARDWDYLREVLG
ncbi:MAG TPA: cupin domain-containing protein [Propionibacteriaceae bacterium]|nr:cupin domain-containing protein [Propionibacteriaceae bacterium]